MPEPGTYNDVTAGARAVKERESGTVELAIECNVPDGTSITAYLYLIQRDGSLGTKTIERLKEAIGWDGIDLEYLVNGEWPPFQIEVGDEVYNNEPRRKVKWLNPNNGSGTPTLKSDDLEVLKQKIGAKLRAFSGGTPVKPPTNAPSKPPAKKLPPPVKAQELQLVSSQQEVWDSFVEKHAELDEAMMTSAWFKFLEENAPGKAQAELTTKDWGRLMAVVDAWPF